ncbi:alanine racemase, partial [Bacillus vallismortis]|nr:alanine racemase [Bacillus vallismortis]
MTKLCREVWSEVNLDAIKKNLRVIRRHIPNKSKIMAGVKATGSGHGSVEVARHALEHGARER